MTLAERQYVVFKLESEEYGIDIMNVREITAHEVPIRIPNIPNYIDGVINIRGSVVPVINLKRRINTSYYDIRERIEYEKH